MKDYKYSLEIMEQELENKYICPEVKYAFQTSVEALRKGMPTQTLNNSYDVWFCPSCKGSVWQIKSESNYCFRCGQKLNWK